MSEENTVIEDEVNEVESNAAPEQETVQEAPSTTEQEIDPIEQAVNERLQQMKSNMDRMVKERDEA